MRKLLIPLLLLVALSGCVTLPTVKNPLASQPTLVSVESAYGAGLAIAVQYRSACAAKKIAQSCRAVVERLQNADRYAYAQLQVARVTAKRGDTLSLPQALSVASDAVNAFVVAAQGAQ